MCALWPLYGCDGNDDDEGGNYADGADKFNHNDPHGVDHHDAVYMCTHVTLKGGRLSAIRKCAMCTLSV